MEASCIVFRFQGCISGIFASLDDSESALGGTDRLHDDLRLISAVFTDLDRFLLERTLNEGKHSFSIFSRSRGVNVETEKLRKMLENGRTKLQMNLRMLPSTFDVSIAHPGSGYTDLLIIFEDRLKQKSRDNGLVVSSALARQSVPTYGYLTPPISNPGLHLQADTDPDNDTVSVALSDIAKYCSTSPEPTTQKSLALLTKDTSSSAPPMDETTSYRIQPSASMTSDTATQLSMTHRANHTRTPIARPEGPASFKSVTQNSTLEQAVRAKDHRLIKELLEARTSPSGSPAQDVLHLAVSLCDLSAMRLLLRAGAYVDTQDCDGRTCLYFATECMFLAGAQLLLQHGADPNLRVHTHDSPFAASLVKGKEDFALFYLNNGAHVNALLENGNTPLIQALETTCDRDLVESMLKRGADSNHKNEHGETALFKAVSAGRPDHVTTLLEHHANADLPGPKHPGPKHVLWAAVRNQDILKILLERGASLRLAPGILELATSINNAEAVKLLLKHGADPNGKKDGIYTPLCSAIRDGRETLVDLLLQAGADPNWAALDCPILKCVSYRRPHLLSKILDAGADLKCCKGIVEACVATNEAECLGVLLQHGADVNGRSDSGKTTTAIKRNDNSMIEFLLQNGSDPAVRGQEWPVDLAVSDPQILEKLLEHMRTEKINKGALERAVMADQLQSVKLLLAQGIDVEDRNAEVFSALTTSIVTTVNPFFDTFLMRLAPTRMRQSSICRSSKPFAGIVQMTSRI